MPRFESGPKLHFLAQFGTIDVPKSVPERCGNGDDTATRRRAVASPDSSSGANGKLVAKTRTFETHTAAKRWANVTEGRISGDEYTDRSKERRATLKEIVERYAREISPSKKGHASEVYRLRAWAAEEFANGPFCLSSP